MFKSLFKFVYFPKKLGSVCFRSPLFYVKFMSAASNKQSFTVSYLIDTLGFSPERAASVSKYIRFESGEKPNLVIKFFENQGFSQAQALKVVSMLPNLLRLDPDRVLLPKIEFLRSRGILSSDIPKIILPMPNILQRSLEKHIVPCFDFFSNLFQSDEKFVGALKRFLGMGIIVRTNTAVIPNINLLRAEGVSDSHIIKLLEYQPMTFCRESHRFKAYVKEVKELGFNHLKFTFVIAVSVLSSMTKSTWARKAGAFKMWGWTDDEMLAAFRRYPLCMAYSENNIEAKLEFFVKKMGCKSSIIARHPQLLGLSLDKRIIPRNTVIQVLLSKGLVTKVSLRSIFKCSETLFMKRYILRHEKEAEELLKLYRAKL